jgi:type IV pilus assembly protein PilE
MQAHRSTSSIPPQGGHGFTLIELMITVAIISVLAMVAMPAYFDSVRKSRRADAVTSLNQIAQAQERWRANNPSYTTNLGSTGLNVSNPSSGYYTLSVTAASSASYSATATAAGAQLKDTRCATFTLAASGGQFTYSATPAANSARCWSR